VGCYIWYSEEPLLARLAVAVPNVTAHPSTASVPINALLYYDGGSVAVRFSVAIITIEGLTS